MVLSNRERFIGIAAGAVIGVLALDHFFISPLLASMNTLDVQVKEAEHKMEEADLTFETSKRLSRRWSEMNQGAVKRDASEAESQALNRLREWAQESRMSLSSLAPERNEKEKEFQKITFRATGSGTMEQISRFLHLIQTAPIPIRVTDLVISTRKEGTDDLAIQLAVATVYLPPESEKPAKPAAAGGREAPR